MTKRKERTKLGKERENDEEMRERVRGEREVGDRKSGQKCGDREKNDFLLHAY